MKIDTYYQRQKNCSGSVEFINVQMVHKFAGRVILAIDFKVMIFFAVKYHEHSTDTASHNGRLIESYIICRIVPFSMTLNDP